MMDISIGKTGIEPVKMIVDISSQKQLGNLINAEEAEKYQTKTSSSEASAGKTSDDQAITPEEAKELTENLQKYIDRMNVNINIAFSTYGEIKEKTMITISERETGKVIREIPAEELQRLYEKMEEVIGVIFSEKV